MAVTIHSHHLWCNCHAIASVGVRRESFKYSEPLIGVHIPFVMPIFINPMCSALSRNKESRKRNLFFHLPAAVACSPSVRLYQTDSSYISLGEIYDLHCEETGIPREEPILFVGEKIRKVLREYRQQTGKTQVCSPLRPFFYSHLVISRSQQRWNMSH